MRFGFYDYASAAVGTDGVIYKNDLTSLAGLPAGTTEIGVGTHTYSSAGFTGAATASLSIIGVANQALLAVEGTLACRVSPSMFSIEGTNGLNENVLAFKTGQNAIFSKNTLGRLLMLSNSNLDNRESGTDQFTYFRSASVGTDMVDLVLSWDQGGIDIWVNQGLMQSSKWESSSTRPSFAEIYINGQSSSGGVYTWTDLLISSKKVVIPSGSLATNVIHFYGDSYVQQGQYPPHDTSDRPAWSHQGVTDNGTDYQTEDGKTPDTGYKVPANVWDSGMFINMQRELNRQNLFTSKIRFWGIGGGGVESIGIDTPNTVPTRVSTALGKNYAAPDIAVIVCGYNDANKSQATMKASWQTMLDEIIARNSNIKIIVCTLPFGDNGTFSPTLTEVQTYNTMLYELAASNSEITIVDIYTKFGTSDNAAWFSVDGIHPSYIGQVTYGRMIGAAIASAVI